MAHRAVLIKAAIVLLSIWIVVWGIRSWAGSRRTTMVSVEKAVQKANFDDWSAEGASHDPAEAARREKELRNIAGMVNRLDFRERQKTREQKPGDRFYDRLDSREKELFFDLTIRETMETFVTAIDAMSPEQRKSFVEQALRDLENGRSKEDVERTQAMGKDVLEKASGEGMRAYYSKASAQTKLDMAPLMEAMTELMRDPQQH
ncbi:hypothetical protein [Luteolibacter sp. LG18]|uniref:hypothetical protein n=1 Tax=Luteolibacter sp. LG18 TaxID=2819286 RepID=UPI002B2CC1EC|nr:hypothetical protein llg_14690 [Luteolibacter sp. LG18]